MTTTALRIALSPSTRTRRWLLVAIELVIAVNAVGGAIWGLAGAKNVPREWLEGTPFDSYLIPSLILLIAVGGGMTAAAVALLLRYRRAADVSIAAGLVLMGWITTQLLMIAPNGGVSWLQPTMFAAGLLVAAFARRLRRDETPGLTRKELVVSPAAHPHSAQAAPFRPRNEST